MSHNTLPTVAELSGEMRERLAKVKYVFTDLDATMLAPVLHGIPLFDTNEHIPPA